MTAPSGAAKAPSFPPTTLGAQQAFLFRLLYDAELRARFARTPQAVASTEKLPHDVAAPFLALDPWRLELDAAGRADYLLSHLCRQLPLTSAAIGAALGTAPFEAFLASPALLLPMGARSPAFAVALRAAANQLPGPPPATALVHAIVGVEAARVDAAAALRVRAEHGEAGPAASPTGRTLAPETRLGLPHHLVVGEWPVPAAAIQGALAGVQAQSAWHLIHTGSLSWARFVTVARADALPVTVVSRAVVLQVAGAGAGVRPVVEISQRVAELSGRQGAFFQDVDGARLRDLSVPHQSLATQLVRAGILEALG